MSRRIRAYANDGWHETQTKGSFLNHMNHMNQAPLTNQPTSPEPNHDPTQARPLENHAPFSFSARIRFHEADPAGIMFFANSYKIAHDTYEEFVQALGFPWPEWFENPVWAIPIRASSCEHLRPLLPSGHYDIEVWIEGIGNSSFTAKYAFRQKPELLLDSVHLSSEPSEPISSEPQCSELFCEVSLTHTFMNKETRTKMAIPSSVLSRLEAYHRQCLKAKQLTDR
jgi:acyl-CoA thioesterase FadM